MWKSPERKKKTMSPAMLTPRREHKKGISRHRHQWQQGGTPPDYWNIGFPSTQEAADINEQAKEMHQKKKEEIQFEANKKDGRYKRR